MSQSATTCTVPATTCTVPATTGTVIELNHGELGYTLHPNRAMIALIALIAILLIVMVIILLVMYLYEPTFVARPRYSYPDVKPVPEN